MKLKKRDGFRVGFFKVWFLNNSININWEFVGKFSGFIKLKFWEWVLGNFCFNKSYR